MHIIFFKKNVQKSKLLSIGHNSATYTVIAQPWVVLAPHSHRLMASGVIELVDVGAVTYNSKASAHSVTVPAALPALRTTLAPVNYSVFREGEGEGGTADLVFVDGFPSSNVEKEALMGRRNMCMCVREEAGGCGWGWGALYSSIW